MELDHFLTSTCADDVEIIKPASWMYDNSEYWPITYSNAEKSCQFGYEGQYTNWMIGDPRNFPTFWSNWKRTGTYAPEMDADSVEMDAVFVDYCAVEMRFIKKHTWES